MDRAALADFLRRRRETLHPSDVGLPEGPRRRAPGLRREEVARLAAMSADYYTRLEQQRGPQPSEQILASLARALDHLDDSPALVLSNLGETLLQNRLSAALLGDRSGFTGLERSEYYRWFVHPDTERIRYPEGERTRQSRAQVAALRVAYGTMGADSRAGELVRALLAASPEFVELWDRHEVAKRFEDHKTLVHPELGPIGLDCQVLFTEDQSQCLLVLTALPRSEGAEKLDLLGVLGTQAFS